MFILAKRREKSGSSLVSGFYFRVCLWLGSALSSCLYGTCSPLLLPRCVVGMLVHGMPRTDRVIYISSMNKKKTGLVMLIDPEEHNRL